MNPKNDSHLSQQTMITMQTSIHLLKTLMWRGKSNSGKSAKGQKYCLSLFLLAIVIKHLVFADVMSTNGKVLFDINSDSHSEARLDSTGLAIGQDLVPSSNLHVQGNAIISNNLSAGSLAGNSSLAVSGTIGYSVQTVVSNTTLGAHSVIFADTTSGNINLTLPYAGNVRGRIFSIKKISSANRLWVIGGGNLIDGSVKLEVTTSGNNYPYVNLISQGNQWYITSCSKTLTDVASSNLVGWWPFDELSGTIAGDISSQNLAATVAGNWTSGAINGAISFDGSPSNFANVGSNSVYNFTANTDFSVAFWMYPVAIATNDVIVSRGMNGGGGWYIQIDSSGLKIKFVTNNPITSTISSNVISNLSWYHVAAIKSGNLASIYINGAETGYSARPPMSPVTSYSGNLTFGRYNNGSPSYEPSMLLDDVRIFNKALNADEVLKIFQSR